MIRSWQDVDMLDPPLNAAERKLVEQCKAGKPCRLGDGRRPEGPDPAREIRADLLRYLILGGCEGCRVHEWGVRLWGAWVSGTLDLSFATAKGAIGLSNCRFEHEIVALQARLELLNLVGSFVPGLNAQGAKVSGALFLREGFEADGEVRLTGTEIGGQLDCTAGKFRNAARIALNAQDVKVSGTLFLRQGFEADGEVNLSGAEIGGQLACDAGKFRNAAGIALNAQGANLGESLFLGDGFEADGGVRLSGAEIGGQLDCEGGKFSDETGRALDGQRMHVGEGLIWRGVSVKKGRVVLTSAHVGDLVDDLASWPEGENRLILDGFTYDRIAGSFTDTGDRLEWLKRGTAWKGEFFPQPYSQLAKVFREMGHLGGARKAMRVQRQRVAEDERRRRWEALADRRVWRRVRNAWFWTGDWLVRRVVGYGYAPFRSLGALVLLWAAATLLGGLAWHSGAMVPNSAVMLTAPGWLAVEAAPNAALEWSLHDLSGRDWETFNPLIWGFDVVVPLVEVGQTEAWAPSPARGGWGWAAWLGRWLLATAGWVVAALAVAAFTGIIRRDDE